MGEKHNDFKTIPDRFKANKFAFAGQHHTAEGRNLIRQMSDSEFTHTIESTNMPKRTESFLKQIREAGMEPDLRSEFDKLVKELI